MTSREQVIEVARSWKGVPWKHQQYSRYGCDCIGFVGGVALELGLPGAEQWRDTPEFHNYGRSPDPKLLLRGADLLMDRIEVDEILLADILVMSWIREPQHFGFVSSVDPLYLLHSFARAGEVVENIVDAKWRSRIRFAYRLRGVG